MKITDLRYRDNGTELLLRVFKTERVALNCQTCVYFKFLAKMSKLRNIEFLFCFKNTKDYLNSTERECYLRNISKTLPFTKKKKEIKQCHFHLE